jgi:hypothetical protein
MYNPDSIRYLVERKVSGLDQLLIQIHSTSTMDQLDTKYPLLETRMGRCRRQLCGQVTFIVFICLEFRQLLESILLKIMGRLNLK